LYKIFSLFLPAVINRDYVWFTFDYYIQELNFISVASFLLSNFLPLLHEWNRGNFPVGVCKYLFRNNWFHRITSCHHLWTIPLVFWGCGNEIQFLALPLSACVIILNVLLSRCMTPISIEKSLKDDDDKCTSIYLNINLSHEMVRFCMKLVYHEFQWYYHVTDILLLCDIIHNNNTILRISVNN
jgi:hypothetical protein